MKKPMHHVFPLMRSRTQGRMLAELYLHHTSEFSLIALARIIDVSPPVIARDLNSLVDSGFLRDRREGRNRLISANPEHPVHKQLVALALAGHGPLMVLPEILADIEGLSEAWIFGSWAERYDGIEPLDDLTLDILLVGVPGFTSMHQAGLSVRETLGIESHFHSVPHDQWEKGTAPGVISLRAGTLHRVDLEKMHEHHQAA